jgi:hypothetical protein
VYRIDYVINKMLDCGRSWRAVPSPASSDPFAAVLARSG